MSSSDEKTDLHLILDQHAQLKESIGKLAETQLQSMRKELDTLIGTLEARRSISGVVSQRDNAIITAATSLRETLMREEPATTPVRPMREQIALVARGEDSVGESGES